LLFDSLSDAGI